MTAYFSELHYKEVIDINTGLRLGFVYDIEYDKESGRIVAFLTPGKAKFFGLLGYEDDYVLSWDNIVRIGADIVLVDTKDSLRRCKHREHGIF